MKAKLFLLAFFFLIPTATVQADAKSHKSAAIDLLVAMDMETQLQASIDVVVEQMSKANPAMAQKKKQIKKFMNKVMGWDSMKEDLAKIYMKTFTEAELKDITTFFKTPTGKKMATKTPELTRMGMELGMKRVQENQAELMKMMQQKESDDDM